VTSLHPAFCRNQKCEKVREHGRLNGYHAPVLIKEVKALKLPRLTFQEESQWL
jgi:hypothetical protein